jgi:hypothetical protein
MVLIEDRAKSEGRKQKYEEMHCLNTIKETNIQKLEKMMSISSSKLASNIIFCLDKNILDKMIVDEDKKQKEIKEWSERKAKLSSKQQDNFCKAAIKHFNNINLHVGEIKTLLKQVYMEMDSPIKARVEDLRDQLQRCCHCLNMYNLFDPPVHHPPIEITNEWIDDNNNNGPNISAQLILLNNFMNQSLTINRSIQTMYQSIIIFNNQSLKINRLMVIIMVPTIMLHQSCSIHCINQSIQTMYRSKIIISS